MAAGTVLTSCLLQSESVRLGSLKTRGPTYSLLSSPLFNCTVATKVQLSIGTVACSIMKQNFLFLFGLSMILGPKLSFHHSIKPSREVRVDGDLTGAKTWTWSKVLMWSASAFLENVLVCDDTT